MQQSFIQRLISVRIHHLFSLALSFSVASLGLIEPVSVMAGTSTTNTKATATLAAMCNISMQNFNFGTITPGQASSTATASLTALCTKGSTYNITFLYHVWGQDCSYLKGANSGDRFYYYLTTTSNLYVGNNVNQTETGTEATQTFNYMAQVQPSSTPAWSNYSGCYGAVYSGYMPKNPGSNPYVTPDNYSDTNQVQITY
jgi:spore coat protein U-like protein